MKLFTLICLCLCAVAASPCTMPNCACDCHAAPTTAPVLPADTALFKRLSTLDLSKPGPVIQLEARTYLYDHRAIRLPSGTKLIGTPGKTVFAPSPAYVAKTSEGALFGYDFTHDVSITGVDYKAGDPHTYFGWANTTTRLTQDVRLLNACGFLTGSKLTDSTIAGEALAGVGEYGLKLSGGNNVNFKNLKMLHGAVWHCIRLWNVSNSTMDAVQLDRGTGRNPLKWHNGANNKITNSVFIGPVKIGPLPAAENGTDGTPVTALLVTDTTFGGQIKFEAGVYGAQLKRCTITTGDAGPAIAFASADPVLRTMPASVFIENVTGKTAAGGSFVSGPGKLTYGIGDSFNGRALAPTSQPSTQP